MRAHLLAALTLAACETTQPPPCPGTLVATFNFKAVDAVDGGNTCAFPTSDGGAPPSTAFSATVAWDPNGTAAAFCIQRPYADPFLGTHDDNRITVSNASSSTSTGNTVGLCDPGCSVTILEEVVGDVDGGPPFTFSGTLKDSLSGVLPDGGASSCNCGFPCSVTWPLGGAP